MQTKEASNVKVIDVSHHQNSIDWKTVKGDGVAGAFIKATEGSKSVDLKFSSNATSAPAVGVKVGYYHYSHPELNDPYTEAANFYKTVKGFKADFPHVLDVEGDASKIGADKLTAWCVTWLTEVEKLSGHPAMIYTGASFAKSYLGKALAKWPLWIAHYGVDKPMDNPTWNQWAVFQHSSSGSVKGIAGNVDMNVMEKAFYDKYSGAPHPNSPEDTIKVVVNDDLAAYGRLIGDSVYLPLRQLAETLGMTVRWDPETRKVYLYK